MFAKDLISSSIWHPNNKYNSCSPLVSVLLPTYGKESNGFLKRVLDSIVEQTFERFEVIVVDDASDDETVRLVFDYMDRDGRINLITHPKNIGLPAISEWEAYMISRGDYIMFAFDDNYFYPDAFENLVSAISQREDVMCYGKVKLVGVDNIYEIGNADNKNIRIFNYIANSSVIVPKKILNHVGLYDPHILMTRNCDWDLWQRIEKYYEIEFHNILIADEYGLSNDKSLGNTYPFDSWGNYFWRSLDRREKLVPDSLGDYNVFGNSDFFDHITQQAISDLTYRHCVSRHWLPKVNDSLILVLYDGYSTASISHAFYFLPDDIQVRMRIVNIHTSTMSLLSRASVLVVVRGIRVYSAWIQMAKSLNIKIIYYVDDNLVLLNESLTVIEPEISLVSAYDDFDEIWCSTNKLADVYKKFLPKKDVFEHYNSYKNLPFHIECCSPLDVDNGEYLTFGFFGGSHRLLSFFDSVIPQLNLFLNESECSIRLIMAGLSIDNQERIKKTLTDSVDVIFMPFNLDWEIMMRRFRYHNCKFIIHSSSDSENRPYKTDNALVCATYAGAVLCTDEDDIFKNAILHDACLSIRKECWGSLFKSISVMDESGFLRIKNNAIDFIYGKSVPERILSLISSGDRLLWSESERRVSLIESGVNSQIKISVLEEQILLKDIYIAEKQAILDERYRMILDLQRLILGMDKKSSLISRVIRRVKIVVGYLTKW